VTITSPAVSCLRDGSQALGQSRFAANVEIPLSFWSFRQFAFVIPLFRSDCIPRSSAFEMSQLHGFARCKCAMFVSVIFLPGYQGTFISSRVSQKDLFVAF
jgi:hypothetical protein